MQPTPSSPIGHYRDLVVPARGREIDRGWRPNLVVDHCRVLLAAFMMGGQEAAGIQSLLVGQGLASWDDEPEPPERSIEALTDPSPVEVAVTPSQIEFLDAGGEVTSEPTSRLQVTVTLPPGTPPVAEGEEEYPLREFALMGGLGGASSMIDYVRHPVIHKRADDTLVRTIRLVF